MTREIQDVIVPFSTNYNDTYNTTQPTIPIPGTSDSIATRDDILSPYCGSATFGFNHLLEMIKKEPTLEKIAVSPIRRLLYFSGDEFNFAGRPNPEAVLVPKVLILEEPINAIFKLDIDRFGNPMGLLLPSKYTYLDWFVISPPIFKDKVIMDYQYFDKAYGKTEEFSAYLIRKLNAGEIFNAL